MISSRRALARSLTFAFVLGTCVPIVAFAQGAPAAVEAPTPGPMPELTGSPLPYPAYGTPAPDVAARRAKPNVPAQVSLPQAIDIAVVGSPQFATERAQYDAIRAKYGAEKGALYPNLSADASITRNYGVNVGNPGSGATTSGTGLVTTENARISFTQLIYDGGRVIAAIRSAKEADVSGRQTLLRNLQTLAFNVATAYYGVLQADATVNANALLVRQFEAQENSVRAQISAGSAARSDLAAAQFQTAQARGQLISSQGLVIAAQSAFATTLGLDADTAVQPQPLSSTAVPVRALDYAHSVSEALQLRPDYLASQHTVESAKENVRFAKLARFPVLNANGQSGEGRALVSGISPVGGNKLAAGQSLGATLTIPIYDQGLTNFNVATAVSQLDQATAGERLSLLGVQSDVRGALSELISARAALTQAQVELSSARVNVQATQARYRVGAATITDTITAAANAATAARDYVNAVYSEQLAEQRYTFALGSNDLKL
jgi:outer membrane protein TolC